LVGNLIKTATQMTCCVVGNDLAVALNIGNLVLVWGGMFVTNLLCHRYLLEKASIMTNQM
jgi:hypothetical protein